MRWLLLALAFGCVACRTVMAIRVWRDASQRSLPFAQRLGWTFLGLVDARRYWWEPRRDSYFPLDGCRVFALDLKRLRRSEIPWLTRQRVELVRLYRRLASTS